MIHIKIPSSQAEILKAACIGQTHIVDLIQKLQNVDWSQRDSDKIKDVTRNLCKLELVLEDVNPLWDKVFRQLDKTPEMRKDPGKRDIAAAEIMDSLHRVGFLSLLVKAEATCVYTLTMLGANTETKATRFFKDVYQCEDNCIAIAATLAEEVLQKMINLEHVKLDDCIELAVTEASKVLRLEEIPLLISIRCMFCKGRGHTGTRCWMKPEQKLLFLRHVCIFCLDNDHSTKDCPNPSTCHECGGLHHHTICSPIPRVASRIGYVSPERRWPCAYCREFHQALYCTLTTDGKLKMIALRKLCSRCLSRNHTEERCPRQERCQHCGDLHLYTHCKEYKNAQEVYFQVVQQCHPDNQELMTKVNKELQARAEEDNNILRKAFKETRPPWFCKPCKYCEDLDHHAEKCPRGPEVRRLAVIVKKLCQRCLSNEHVRKSCPYNNIRCLWCQGDHFYRNCEQSSFYEDPSTMENPRNSYHQDSQATSETDVEEITEAPQDNIPEDQSGPVDSRLEDSRSTSHEETSYKGKVANNTNQDNVKHPPPTDKQPTTTYNNKESVEEDPIRTDASCPAVLVLQKDKNATVKDSSSTMSQKESAEDDVRITKPPQSKVNPQKKKTEDTKQSTSSTTSATVKGSTGITPDHSVFDIQKEKEVNPPSRKNRQNRKDLPGTTPNNHKELPRKIGIDNPNTFIITGYCSTKMAAFIYTKSNDEEIQLINQTETIRRTEDLGRLSSQQIIHAAQAARTFLDKKMPRYAVFIHAPVMDIEEEDSKVMVKEFQLLFQEEIFQKIRFIQAENLLHSWSSVKARNELIYKVRSNWDSIRITEASVHIKLDNQIRIEPESTSPTGAGQQHKTKDPSNYVSLEFRRSRTSDAARHLSCLTAQLNQNSSL